MMNNKTIEYRDVMFSKVDFKNNTLVFLFLLLGFSLPSSTAILNLSLVLIIIYSVLFVPKSDWILVIKHPIVVVSLLLFSSVVIHQVISENVGGWELVSKYRKWAYILMLSPLFLYAKDKLKYIAYGFCTANVIVLFLSLFVWITGFGVLNIPVDNPTVFKLHITQNFFMAISCVLFFYFAMKSSGKDRGFFLAICLASIVNIIFCVQGRTGYLAILTAISVIPFFFLDIKKTIAVCFIGALMASGVFFTDNSASERVKLGFNEIERCVDSGDYTAASCNSSMGLRIFYWNSALKKIKSNPLFGYGPSNQFIPRLPGSPEGYSVENNPHNEYLMQGVQLGFYGIILFLSLHLIAIFKLIKSNSQQEKLVFVVLSMYITANFFNSFVNDIAEGTLYMIVFAIVVALTLPKNQSKVINNYA
ncbi:MAG: O-antigen ligase family protein [Plesiomonas sp.]